MKPLLRLLLYVGSAIGFFLIFLVWTFPYGVVVDNVVQQLETNLGGEYRISVREKSGSIFSGLSLSDVEVAKNTSGSNELVLKARSLNINPSFSTLLSRGKTIKASFAMKTAKGELSGSFADLGSEIKLDFEFDPLVLGEVKILESLTGLHLRGEIRGEGSFVLSKKGFEKNSGQMDLQFSNLTLEPLALEASPVLALLSPKPRVEFQKLLLSDAKSSKLSFKLSKGNAELMDWSLKGGDVELNLKGTIKLGQKLEENRADLKGSIRIKESFEKTFFEELPGLSSTKSERLADGSNPFELVGLFSKLSLNILNLKGGVLMPIPLSGSR